MTDKIAPKKVKASDKIIKYPLGQGDSFNTIPSANGYNYWGYVAGEHIQGEGENLQVIEKQIIDYLTKAKISHLNKASRCEEIVLRIKEGGLEKTAKDLGEKK